MHDLEDRAKKQSAFVIRPAEALETIASDSESRVYLAEASPGIASARFCQRSWKNAARYLYFKWQINILSVCKKEKLRETQRQAGEFVSTYSKFRNGTLFYVILQYIV